MQDFAPLSRMRRQRGFFVSLAQNPEHYFRSVVQFLEVCFDAYLVFPPSRLVHGVLHGLLSHRLPLAGSPYHGAGHLGPLSAGRFHPVLQIRHRAVSGVVRLDPVHFVLSALESAPCRLLAALPAFVCGHDLCTGLLYRPAHGALPAALRPPASAPPSMSSTR